MFEKINESFKEKINKPLFYSTFALFLIILVWIVFFKFVNTFNNKIIIYTAKIMPKLNIYERFAYRANVSVCDQFMKEKLIPNIANIIVFIPFGLFLPLFNKKKYLINLLISFLISLGIELIQVVFGLGGFEIIDLITNPVGYSIGYLIYLMIKRFLTPQVINYICLTMIILFLPVAIYGYASLIINIELIKPFFSADNFKNLFNFN